MRKHPTFKYKEVKAKLSSLKTDMDIAISSSTEQNVFSGIDKFLTKFSAFVDYVDDQIENDPFISKEKLEATDYIDLTDNIKTFLSSVVLVGKLFGSCISLYPSMKNQVLNDENLKKPVKEVDYEVFMKLERALDTVHNIQVKAIVDLTENPE